MRQYFYEFYAGLSAAQVQEKVAAATASYDPWQVHTLIQQTDGTFALLLEHAEDNPEAAPY